MTRLTNGPRGALHFKDDVLDHLAEKANVAQFVSFSPGSEPDQRRLRIHGYPRHHEFRQLEEAIRVLLAASPAQSVNVRSFDPRQPKAHDFFYALTSVEEIAVTVRRLASRGLYTIANETIDVNDGGVSGVAYAGVIEFAPDDTPRCVEKPGTTSLPTALALDVLETVYGFRPSLDYQANLRVEFSVHPLVRGLRREHTIVWEVEPTEPIALSSTTQWPNRFSRLIGDKAFGLLIADTVGLPVPATTVISRRIAPFSFGRRTGSGEHWIRTCPAEQMPGRFTTRHGWLDPFVLMATEDPDGRWIPSVLEQEGITAAYSGASVVTAEGGVIVEGVPGTGEDFMQGREAPQTLPKEVLADVESIHRAAAKLGPVRFEWVHDGEAAWVVQLHQGTTQIGGQMIYPGEASSEHRFQVEDGLEALRALAEKLAGSDEGIVLVGNVGVTSHFGDVLRRERIPSRIERPGASPA